MAGHNYYLVTALPPLGELGSTPPLKPGELLEHVREIAGPRAVVEVILLGDDLLQREAFLAGELEEVFPAVLMAEEIRNVRPLPEYLLVVGEEASGRIATDTVWAAYFRHAAGVGRREASDFLRAWVQYEVGLRNALAAARARALSLGPDDYLVATELVQTDGDFNDLLNAWAAAEDPLAGLRVLDSARWAWLAEHDAWFTFADDELAAYAARLMLLRRWHRLTAAQASSKDS